MDVDEFLEHHGVLGMKWGVRRSRGGSVSGATKTPSKSSVKPAWQKPPTKKVSSQSPPSKGRFVKAKRGQKILSEDARQMHEIRMKVKREGIQSLTNKDLELINKRMELQQKYKKNFPKKKNPLVDLVIDTILSDAGEKHVLEFLAPRSPNSAVMARNAILLNRTVRTIKK